MTLAMPTSKPKLELFPIGERVLVERDKADAVSEGGLLIPEKAREKPRTGKVLAVGDECKKLKVGDVVLFAAFSGTPIYSDDDAPLIMREDEVLCVAR